MSILPSYTSVGGVHPEAAAATNVLAAAGLRRPDTVAPLSEALIFGIAGGLGALYILWEWEAHNVKVLVLGFHHLGNYPVRYFQGLADRLNVRVAMPETGSRRSATQTLDGALAAGKPAVAWVDRASLPHLQLPERLRGRLGHLVAVCGRTSDGYWIDDRAAAPFFVPADTFGDARERIPSYKQRLLLIDAVAPFDLPAAVQSGITAQLDYLGSDSDSFALPALRKWARLLTHPTHKKGYPVVFADRRGLFRVLRAAYEEITLNVGAGALRGLYADFLREAAQILENQGLLAAADAYAALSVQWLAFADAALPDTPFAPFKQLLLERHTALLKGGDAWHGWSARTEELEALDSAFNREFPLDDGATNRLFADLGEQMHAIYSQEVAALDLLKHTAM
ncbi:MAG TPA: BtrH N-terminal domain-containing protein [Chloroflexaceae bacterium]|nr:BtrH N-terminal domain-containing protein [Chloroflexaceae bacterium]